MNRNSRNSQNEEIVTFVARVIFADVTLPFVEVYFIGQPEKRTLGIALLVVGLALWIVTGIMSA